MPSSETPGNSPSYPQGASFGQLLSWHLDHGTRPDGRPGVRGKPWSNKDFAAAIGKDERSVRNWRNERKPAQDLIAIETELFGDTRAYDDWCHDLRDAHRQYKGAKLTEADVPFFPNGTDIPFPPGDFLGRDTDLKAIRNAILSDAATRAILVQGPPGIGKTALTKAVGHDPEVIKHFSERPRWFVRLETATSAALLQDAITRTVGADPQAGFRATLSLLQQRSGLLVLDNFETPWELLGERRATEEVLAALSRVPGLTILVSFRGRERVAGPAWTLIHPVERLTSPFDVKLFNRVAGQSFAGDPHLECFLAALDGVPLAIELVAHHAYGSTSLAPLWAEWERIGAELARHPDYEPERDTSLPHSIELSLHSGRMTVAAHRLFRLLGQLPAGIAAIDRDHLLGAESFAADGALRRIGLAFVRGERLDLLSPLREHARRRCRPERSDEVAWSAHYFDLTRRLGEKIGTKDGTGVITRLVPEFANISAAIAVALPHRIDEAMAALGGFGHLTRMASIPAPILHDLAAACRGAGDVRGEANCISSLGGIALARSDHEAARAAFEQVIPLYHQIGDVRGEASCISSLGEIALARSDHEAARAAFEQARSLCCQISNVQGEANCISGLGQIALRRSDHGGAQTAFEQAVPLYRQIGDVLGEANCIVNLGNIMLRRSDHDSAHQQFERAITLYHQVGNVLGEANCIRNLGDIALARSDHNGAHQLFGQSMVLYRQVGDVLGEANCIRNLGQIALRRSDHNGAYQLIEQATPLYRQVGDVLGEANCVRNLGQIALRRSDYEAAQTAFEQALPLYRQVGDILGETNCVFGLGQIALNRSGYADARKAFEQALLLYRQIGDVQGEANSVSFLGDVALALSDNTTARQLFEQALPLYRQIGSVLGEANCIFSFGEIALARSDRDGARQLFEQALILFRRIVNVRGEADCIRHLADLE